MSEDILVHQPHIEKIEDYSEDYDFDEFRVFFELPIDIIGINRCVVTRGLDDPIAWVHEFIEMPLYKHKLYRLRNIPFSIKGEVHTTTIAHLLASFTGGATLDGRLISPEEFDHHLLENCRASQDRWRNRNV